MDPLKPVFSFKLLIKTLERAIEAHKVKNLDLTKLEAQYFRVTP